MRGSEDIVYSAGKSRSKLQDATAKCSDLAKVTRDALNGIVILDHKTLEKLDPLAPKNGVLDLRTPRAISGHVSLSSTMIATIANFIHHGK